MTEREVIAQVAAANRRWLAALRRPPEVRRFAGHASFATRLSRPIRVAHLTDLHVGRVTPMEVQFAAVELANAQKPDLVALTGDYVCHGQRYLDQVVEIVRRFEAPVVAVLGNHDHWSGGEEVRQALRQAGAVVLDNASVVIEIDGQALQVVGLDDAFTGHANVDKALSSMQPELPTLGLSHIPEEAAVLWRHGIPLVLAGHTHAGQVAVGGMHNWLGKLCGQRFIHGLYGSRLAPAPEGALYVGAGIGAAVVPLRVGARARREVAIFELGVPPGTFPEHHLEQAGHPGREVSARKKASRAAKVVRNAQRRDRHGKRPD